jgi:hypothetical protein
MNIKLFHSRVNRKEDMGDILGNFCSPSDYFIVAAVRVCIRPDQVRRIHTTASHGQVRTL